MMTVSDIRDHAERLQDRLESERRKVRAGHYHGHPSANLDLIRALEGRVAELLEQCDLLELVGVQVTTVDLEALLAV